MPAFIKLILTVTLCAVFNFNLTAQNNSYDFDSLLEHSPQLKPLIKMVMDTFQIFGPQEPLEFTVSTDLKSLAKNKYKDEYQDAQVIYQLWDTISISRVIRIKPRGEFRLKNCTNPPLRVNVKQTKEVFELLDELDKLKMVVPCKGPSVYQSYIFTEYIAYKLYNIITDFSFKVRLIKLNYYDTGGKVKAGNAYTFIIESMDALSARHACLPIKNEKIGAKSLDDEQVAILFLFQYMIGNTDWSVPGLHNMKLLKTRDVTRPLPLPVAYDFDYSGLVNAPYAIPGDHVDIESVTERIYMGHCLPPEITDKTFDLFIAKESELMEEVGSFDLMPDAARKKALAYIEDFFDIIKDPKRRENRIVKQCRP